MYIRFLATSLYGAHVRQAAQAACAYIVLFFAPAVLQGDTALMRVLVDKHFVDNWVVAWAPGFTSDLAQEWANYKVGRFRV